MKKNGSKTAALALALWMAAAAVCAAPTVVYASGEGAVSAAEAAAQEAVEISDARGLLAIADAPEGAYRLTADIDLGGIDWQPLVFKGTLDGAGHTLYNLRVTKAGTQTGTTKDGNLKVYKTEFAGLFSAVEKASVKNLNIVGAEISMESDTHCFAAILTGSTDDSTFTNCSVQGRVHMINHGINAGVAGLAGYGWGVFDKCSADVELVFEDRYRNGHCEQFMGGVLSCGMATIRDCSVTIDGYDSCHGYVHNGGVVGMFYHCGLKYSHKDVTGNRVQGQIHFFEHNKDRRAYCTGIIGERLSGCRTYTDNKAKFKRDETFNYTKVLLPETCEAPRYTETVTPSGCADWGYTVHTCEGCGYHWTDSYTPPQHTPGAWEATDRVSETGGSIEQRVCTVCGEVTEERVTSDGVSASDAVSPSDAKGLFGWNKKTAAIGGSSALLLAAAAGVILLFRKKKNRR